MAAPLIRKPAVGATVSPGRSTRKTAAKKSPPEVVKRGPMDTYVSSLKGASPYVEAPSEPLKRDESLPSSQLRVMGGALARRTSVLSQDQDSLSQAGFSALSSQSQDWLAGTNLFNVAFAGAGHDAAQASPPPAPSKKRKPAADAVYHVNNSEDALAACVREGESISNSIVWFWCGHVAFPVCVEGR